MWNTEIFSTREAMTAWMKGKRIQYCEIFLDNAFGIEYRPIREVYPEDAPTHALANSRYIATGTQPDGYNGDRVTVEFYYDTVTHKTYCYHRSGYHTSGLPPALTPREALWLLEHHPSAANVTITHHPNLDPYTQ